MITTNTPDWKVSILVNHQRTSFKIDTGAQCTVISKSRYHQLGSTPLHKSHAKLVAFGGKRLNTCGKVTMKCEYKRHTYAIRFEVIDQDVPNILGLQTCVDMNLVQRLDAINSHDTDLLESYSNVFEGLCCISNTDYHIKTDKAYQPVVHPPRRVPVTLQPKIQAELTQMEELDVIEKVVESTDWINSMVTIIKPNGSLRICIDHVT